MFRTIMMAVAVLTALVVGAQTALDPTMGGAYPAYPTYLGVSCGGVSLTVLGERTNADTTVDAMVAARTSCSGSGRGAPVRRYLACWDVKFASDRYAVVSRDRLLYATWIQGKTSYVCPALE